MTGAIMGNRLSLASSLLPGWVIPFFFLHAGPVVKFPRGKRLVAAMLLEPQRLRGVPHALFLYTLALVLPPFGLGLAGCLVVCLPRGPAASALAWFTGGELQFEPADFFPLPPVGWFPWVWWPPGCLSCPFPLLRFLLPFVGFPFALPSRHCWCWLTV